ncbi:MAG: penicillin-binding transpeptidase domain-containing protein [Myxococcales bacterium]
MNQRKSPPPSARERTPVPPRNGERVEPRTQVESAPGRRGLLVRVSLLLLVLSLAAGKVLHRAYEIQVRSPENYERHYREEIEVEAKRGNIYDRRGAELAVSVELDSVFADPVALRNNHLLPGEVARALSPVLGIPEAALVPKLSTNKRFVWLKRRVSPRESGALAQLGLLGKGIAARKEPRRFYPNVTTAAHVLGFTNDQGQGVEGLERTFETRLHGAVDKVAAILDARGGVVFSEELTEGQKAQGHDLTLTLDREIQVVAERELELAVRAAEARAGHVVVMDPHTGEILALANYPTFNPNDPGAADPSARRNRAVTDRFEPGSVVKAFTVAGALAAGVVGPSQRIDCEGGTLQVGEFPIRDTHHWDELTPAEILAYSSNIGTAKIGAALGRPGLFRVLRRFGFGTRTELDLPAEAEGMLRHYKRWYDMDAATISFGQGMSATSVQLATAMAAIANGGRLMKPLLVSRVTDSQGNVVEEMTPSVRRQVVPSHVARLVGDMLTGVTASGGTGEAAAMEGYLVAGKTGTAQKADFARGGYAPDAWTATFVGFVPANRPRLVISVVIDEPVIEHYGGTIAGPVFRRVAAEALRHLGVPPAQGGAKLAELVKNLRDEKQAELADTAAEQTPTAGEPAPKLDSAQLEPATLAAAANDQIEVPRLKGLGARAALVALRRLGLDANLSGSGVVAEQSPEAGKRTARGTSVQLVLKELGREPVQSKERVTGNTLASVAPIEIEALP